MSDILMQTETMEKGCLSKLYKVRWKRRPNTRSLRDSGENLFYQGGSHRGSGK